MTGVEIASKIRTYFNRMYQMRKKFVQMDKGNLNKNVKSIVDIATGYLIDDIKKECVLVSFDINMDKKTIEVATPYKGYTYHFREVDGQFKIYFPTNQMEYYSTE